MNERPKSREETPKEGKRDGLESHTALQQYVVASHKVQVSLQDLSGFSETLMHLSHEGWFSPSALRKRTWKP